MISDVIFGVSGRKIFRGLILLGMILLFGTMGYMLIEGWPFFEALYMTVITITTVGYQEIREVGETGRVFTIFIIFMGMGIMAYTLGMVAQTLIESGDTLIAMGRTVDLDRLSEILACG